MAYSQKTRTSVEKNNLKLTADKVIQILDQVRDEGKKSRRRWIWELMQNAKDVPNIHGRVSISIELSDDKLNFSHNGDPFRIDNITGLIQQVSSKSSDNSEGETTGKFGTGFISTHLLSDIIKVKGILQEPDEVPKKFEIKLDRSGERSEELMPAIEKALDFVEEIDNNELFPPSPDYWAQRSVSDLDNEFIYLLESESAKKAAKIGVDDLKITLPLTLAFLPRISSVCINNHVSSENTTYQCNLLKTTGNLSEIEILITRDGQIPEKICFFIYDKGEVSLAVQTTDFENPVLVEKQPGQPFLYRDFPLIGTEVFYLPFIINGKTLFPTERRDSVLLNKDGEKNKKPVHNQKVFLEAFQAAKDFVKVLIERKAKNLHLAALSRVPDYDFDDESKEWYLELQSQYRTFLLEQKIIDTPEGNEVLKSVWFPRNSTVKEENLELWELASKLVGLDSVPLKDNLLSNLSHIGTFEEKDTWRVPLYFDLEVLFEQIQDAARINSLVLKGIDNATSKDKFDWLNSVYSFAIKYKQNDLFDKYKVVPNKNGVFELLNNMFEEDMAKPIPDEFLAALKDLDPTKDWRNDLINRSINVSALNHKKLDLTDLTEAINDILNQEKREGNIIHKLFLNNPKALELLVSVLKIDSPESKQESIRHKLFNSAKKLFHFEDEFIPVENSGKFDYRPAIKLFIQLIISEVSSTVNITTLAAKLKFPKEETLRWLNNFLTILDTNSEYKYFLDQDNIIPNRNGILCAYDEICNYGTEETPLDDELIAILKAFENELDWNEELVTAEIALKLPNTRKFEELAAALLLEVDQIRINNGYEQYSDQLLRLIDWCSQNKEQAQKFLLAFNEMSNRIFFILTIENSHYGGQLIKMLKKKENLEILAQISESNLNIDTLKELIKIGTELGSIDAILEHARELQYEQNDFDFKLKIGTAVEEAFKFALEAEGIDAEILHKGKGSHDFEIKSKLTFKSVFIELKSQANGSADPIRMAVSQAKKAVELPDQFALCVLERPVNDDLADIDYIKDKIVYRSQMQNALAEVLTDHNAFVGIATKKTPVRLRIALRDDVKVSIENSVINMAPKGFVELIADIKKQIE